MGKTARAWRWPPPPSSTEVKERVELYLYRHSGTSWPVLGRTLPWGFHHTRFDVCTGVIWVSTLIALCLSCVACASTVVLLLCVSKSLIPCRFSLWVFVTHAFASVCHSRCVLSVVLLCGSYRIHPSTYVISTRVLPHSRPLSPDPIYKAKSKNFFPAMMKITSCCWNHMNRCSRSMVPLKFGSKASFLRRRITGTWASGRELDGYNVDWEAWTHWSLRLMTLIWKKQRTAATTRGMWECLFAVMRCWMRMISVYISRLLWLVFSSISVTRLSPPVMLGTTDDPYDVCDAMWLFIKLHNSR